MTKHEQLQNYNNTGKGWAGLSEVKMVEELVEFEEEKVVMTVLVCSWNKTKNTPNIRWEETYFVLYNQILNE